MREVEHVGMSALDAIYSRRAVRDYAAAPLSEHVIRTLLAAAVQAPTAMHEEPWEFAVIRDRTALSRISDYAKARMAEEARQVPAAQASMLERFTQPDFNIFYNADALIVIGSAQQGPFVEADCWLAAENLMLAARALGLGSCVIGLAVKALNCAELKQQVGLPATMTAIAPIIVGVPREADPAAPKTRAAPRIALWKE